MKLNVALLALAISGSAAPAFAEPAQATTARPAPEQCSVGQDGCKPIKVQTQSNRPRGLVDCHRDVRTHRVNGVMLRHRHVGPNCQIREVRQSS